MNRLVLPYPTKPYILNQAWGVLNIDLATGESIYKKFGFTLHNGEDFAVDQDRLVHSEIAGTVFRKMWQPNGGGLSVSILTDEQFEDVNGRPGFVLIDYLHAETILVNVGDKVRVGQPVIVPDNTGFSTGQHTHGQHRWVSKGAGGILYNLDSNEANNSFNPTDYRNGTFAEDLYVPGFKHQFLVNLAYNNRSNEVIKLQEALNIDMNAGLPTTGYYGNLTAAALLGFQLKYNLDTPSVLYALKGRNFGPKSRAKMNELFSN